MRIQRMLLICLAVWGSSALCLSSCPSLKSNWPAAEVKPTHQPLFPNHRAKSYFALPPESSRCPDHTRSRCRVGLFVNVWGTGAEELVWGGGFAFTVAYWLDVSIWERLKVTYSLKAEFVQALFVWKLLGLIFFQENCIAKLAQTKLVEACVGIQ